MSKSWGEDPPNTFDPHHAGARGRDDATRAARLARLRAEHAACDRRVAFWNGWLTAWAVGLAVVVALFLFSKGVTP